MATEARHTIEQQPVNTMDTETCQTTFLLEGMSCASCSMRIEQGLKKVPGVLIANVNLATERGTVTYDPAQAAIEQMVQKALSSVTVVTNSLRLRRFGRSIER